MNATQQLADKCFLHRLLVYGAEDYMQEQMTTDDFQKLVNKEVDIGKCIYRLALGSEDKNWIVEWLDVIKERYMDKGDITTYNAIKNGLIEWVEKQD